MDTLRWEQTRFSEVSEVRATRRRKARPTSTFESRTILLLCRTYAALQCIITISFVQHSVSCAMQGTFGPRVQHHEKLTRTAPSCPKHNTMEKIKHPFLFSSYRSTRARSTTSFLPSTKLQLELLHLIPHSCIPLSSLPQLLYSNSHHNSHQISSPLNIYLNDCSITKLVLSPYTRTKS